MHPGRSCGMCLRPNLRGAWRKKPQFLCLAVFFPALLGYNCFEPLSDGGLKMHKAKKEKLYDAKHCCPNRAAQLVGHGAERTLRRHLWSHCTRGSSYCPARLHLRVSTLCTCRCWISLLPPHPGTPPPRSWSSALILVHPHTPSQ